jgi:hypothetical protein
MNASFWSNHNLIFGDLQVGTSLNHAGEQKESFAC